MGKSKGGSNKGVRNESSSLKNRAAPALDDITETDDLPTAPAQQLERNAILAAAMERSAKGLRGGMLGDVSDVELLHIQRDVVVEESESISRTLEDKDSDCKPGVRRNMPANVLRRNMPANVPASTSCESETNAVGGSHDHSQAKEKATYASHFARNRLPSVGTKLEQFARVDGPISIEVDEVQESWFP